MLLQVRRIHLVGKVSEPVARIAARAEYFDLPLLATELVNFQSDFTLFYLYTGGKCEHADCSNEKKFDVFHVFKKLS